MERYLVMADGTIYEGEAFGADVDAAGELVCHTGVASYIETLTDARCRGQIVVQTFPLIGNYGVIEADFAGPCALSGYVVRAWCESPSNFRSEYTVDELLRRRGVPGLCGVDTRAIAQHLREHGEMPAMLCARPPASPDAVRALAAAGAGADAPAGARGSLPPEGGSGRRVTLVDYGAAAELVPALARRGCAVTVAPADAAAEAILAGAPDGVALSGGPGDPAADPGRVATVARLLGRVPLFGVGLGHQLLALAAGGRTVRLRCGHRGDNQPVTDLRTGRTWITAQNHGYAVSADDLPAGRVCLVNANDRTCEGVDYPGRRAFGVQFRPDDRAGAAGTAFVFDQFMELMGGAGHAVE